MSMPASFMTAIASGRTRLGFVPALSTVKRSPASCRNKPSAICDRAEFPVHRISTRVLSAMRKFRLSLGHDDIPCVFGQRRDQPSEKERRRECARDLGSYEAGSIGGPDAGKGT